MFLDVDVDVYTENSRGTDLGRQLAYITGGTDDYYVDRRLLVADSPQHVTANLSLVDNPTYVYPLNYMPDADQYCFLSAAAPEYIVHQTTELGDYRLPASAGPITLAPGEVHEVAVAIVAGQYSLSWHGRNDAARPPAAVSTTCSSRPVRGR